jgi:UDP-N-acetylglucosamine 1-carboxyvinyltransferase
MAHLVVRGGTRLAGRVTVGGNKNAALPLLAACLLTSETCELATSLRFATWRS